MLKLLKFAFMEMLHSPKVRISNLKNHHQRKDRWALQVSQVQEVREEEGCRQEYPKFRTLMSQATSKVMDKNISCHSKNLEAEVLEMSIWWEIKILGNYTLWKLWANVKFWGRILSDMPKLREMFFRIPDIHLLLI